MYLLAILLVMFRVEGKLFCACLVALHVEYDNCR